MSTGVQTAVGQFVWHEHLSNDVERAKGFYTQLLGWELEIYKAGEMDYPMIKRNGQTHGGFSKLEQSGPAHWLGHVAVDDVDGTVSRAEARGGKTLAGPFDMPEIGRFALIADPQGGVVSAYKPAGDAPSSAGTFVWDELLATDVEGAKSFYTEVFGWTTADMDMGETGVYTMFRRAGETDSAGLMQKPPDAPGPTAWLTYIATDDVDATVEKAGTLGASTLMAPMDIPGVGRIAVLADPTGAAFGLFKPSGSPAAGS